MSNYSPSSSISNFQLRLLTICLGYQTGTEGKKGGSEDGEEEIKEVESGGREEEVERGREEKRVRLIYFCEPWVVVF